MSRQSERRTVVQPRKTQLINRLKRIEGQVRGIQRMIQEDRYCVDILVQIAAVKSAVEQVAMVLIEDHTRHCVSQAIQNNQQEQAIAELMDVIRHLTK
ncbi:MAG: transcriptional regulator [Bacillaceae bacterium G1]|nr:transcriptional regulator [Bacillota bacterium]OJF16769.1 MAG: transcriptional regulator [Bacillaceae bacterium G1]